MATMTMKQFMQQWQDGLKDISPEDYKRDIVVPPMNPRALPLRRVPANMRARKKATIRVRRKAKVYKNCYPVAIEDPITLPNGQAELNITFKHENNLLQGYSPVIHFTVPAMRPQV